MFDSPPLDHRVIDEEQPANIDEDDRNSPDSGVVTPNSGSPAHSTRRSSIGSCESTSSPTSNSDCLSCSVASSGDSSTEENHSDSGSAPKKFKRRKHRSGTDHNDSGSDSGLDDFPNNLRSEKKPDPLKESGLALPPEATKNNLTQGTDEVPTKNRPWGFLRRLGFWKTSKNSRKLEGGIESVVVHSEKMDNSSQTTEEVYRRKDSRAGIEWTHPGSGSTEKSSEVVLVPGHLDPVPTASRDFLLGPDQPPKPGETKLAFVAQVFPPFLLAGLGMVAAGKVLETVQEWEVFQAIHFIMVLVTPILGLKGNIEMTAASRYTTQVNIKDSFTMMDNLRLLGGNLAVDECLAILVGALASVVAIVVTAIYDEFNVNHSLILAASAVLTTSAASLVLGTMMFSVVKISKSLNINPDNVALPVAASLGDVCSLGLLAVIGNWLFLHQEIVIWLCPIIIGVLLSLCPFLAYYSIKNQYTSHAIKHGWTPVICAMFISSVSGIILGLSTRRYSDLANFQPVINGVGGNLVAIHASRISTELHRFCTMGVLPPYHPKILVGPKKAFFAKESSSMDARILFLISLPGQLIFLYIDYFALTSSFTSPSIYFIIAYLIASSVQVILLLYISSLWIYFMWKRHLDPDTTSIPWLTAFGDLFGTGLLFLAFVILGALGEDRIGTIDDLTDATTISISNFTTSAFA